MKQARIADWYRCGRRGAGRQRDLAAASSALADNGQGATYQIEPSPNVRSPAVPAALWRRALGGLAGPAHPGGGGSARRPVPPRRGLARPGPRARDAARGGRLEVPGRPLRGRQPHRDHAAERIARLAY